MPRGEFHTHHRIKAIRGIARQLRKTPTPSEALLWQALRNRQLVGLKFLRQHPIGPSVVDFYCHEKHLVVEIDGPIHRRTDVAQRDKARQELIEGYGIRFFRCKNADVESDLAGVLQRILKAAEALTPFLQLADAPSLAREGDDAVGG